MYSKRVIAKKRSEFYKWIRTFFDDLGYVAVETPVLSVSLIPESAIEVFETKRIKTSHVSHQSESLFLIPSPEIYMKVLISEGIGDCYQITKSFRNMEDKSVRHSNEFTMLEWYGMNINYKDNIEITKKLLRSMADWVDPKNKHLFETFTEVTMSQLFFDYVNIDLDTCITLDDLKKAALQSGFNEYVKKSTSWEMLFYFIFVSEIEKKLPQDKTIFIKNYPAQILTTAKKNGHYYERWELYMKGWEIANCYTEETEYEAMQRLFVKEWEVKKGMKVPHPVHFEYLNIFKNGQFPLCSGSALGVDRLLAVAMNVSRISDVLLFH